MFGMDEGDGKLGEDQERILTAMPLQAGCSGIAGESLSRSRVWPTFRSAKPRTCTVLSGFKFFIES